MTHSQPGRANGTLAALSPQKGEKGHLVSGAIGQDSEGSARRDAEARYLQNNCRLPSARRAATV